MTGGRLLALIVLLAVLSTVGIVGMLLVEGVWDVLFFLLATTPLLAGIVGIRRRQAARHPNASTKG